MAEHKDSKPLGNYWPGIQLYYPPIKYAPSLGIYEDMAQASARMKKHAHFTNAHTLIFDLEDGCRQKEMSRELSDSSIQKCCQIFLLNIVPKLSKKATLKAASQIEKLITFFWKNKVTGHEQCWVLGQRSHLDWTFAGYFAM